MVTSQRAEVHRLRTRRRHGSTLPATSITVGLGARVIRTGGRTWLDQEVWQPRLPGSARTARSGPDRPEDRVSSTLEDVASAADEVADEQRRLARDARQMQRRRDRGWSWAEILDRTGGADNEDSSGLLQRLRRSARRLAELSARTAEMLARGLAEEGESRRRIARRLGVSHQRVSVILGSRAPRLGSRSTLADR